MELVSWKRFSVGTGSRFPPLRMFPTSVKMYTDVKCKQYFYCKVKEDTETDNLFLGLTAELEEVRSNSRITCEEVAKEKKNWQHILSLLEGEKGEIKEMTQTDLQLRDLQELISHAQSQSFELQRYKEENELLNTKLQEMTRMLVREQEKVANSALLLCNLEEEKARWEEEMMMLKEERREELDQIRQLLEEGEKEVEKLEQEDSGIKASKNRQNQERVSFGQDEDEEGGPDRGELSEDGLTGNTDILMARYLATAQSNSSLANQSFEEHIGEENSVNYR